MLLLYSIFNKFGAMTFSLFIDINHVNRAKKYRYQITTYIYVLYYLILKDFLIACHYKTCIMPTLFLLLMSSYAILTLVRQPNSKIDLKWDLEFIQCFLMDLDSQHHI